jgi:RHS repeat-associated protein
LYNQWKHRIKGDRNFVPFRQLGQYEDVETGLYYNRFRYYNSDSGTYISQDPIGLDGENPNFYGYVFDSNSEVDLFWVPRANYVEGLTQEHIVKWGWNVTEDGLINWPDLQSRLYRNAEYIKWENKVHEKIVGFKTVAVLPTGFNLLHIKDIARQEKQNDYYSTLN